ncbi:MAG TPA: hypothetical protein PLJ26_05160 [Candidatus Omnitrophota bacterium]|nr:hypothetical protein [Candidatus Omnitrophota bacterium]
MNDQKSVSGSTRLCILAAAAASVLFFLRAGAQAQDSIIPWPMDEEAARAPRETVLWRALALDFKQRLSRSPHDRNLKISFLNTPLGKHTVEDLMAYTISGDGAVTIQMYDTLKEISVQPEELYWMGKFMFEHGLEDLPDREADDPASPEYRISLRVDGRKKTIRLYNSRNTKDREIIWQYLYSFGLRLLQNAGLYDQNRPIMPVCRGVTGIQEIDADNDGLIDWLKLKVEFYSFKSGDYTLGFNGRKTSVFLPQGNTSQYFYINSYLLKNKGPSLSDFSRISIAGKPVHPKGPYVFDLNIDAAGYAGRDDVRAVPDRAGKGAEPVRFEARLNQEVIIEIFSTVREDSRAVIRFTVVDVQPQGVTIETDGESIPITPQDPLFIHDIECMGCFLRMVGTEGGLGIFEAGWIVPDPTVISNKIAYFNEAFASDRYRGDKEQARLSLDNALACKEAIEHIENLRINVVYASPAE